MLFKVHEKSIIRGNKCVKRVHKIYSFDQLIENVFCTFRRIISYVSSGFYVINPDSNLDNTDRRLTQFLNTRSPQWNGIVRRRPSKDEFLEALTNHRLFL